MKNLLIIIATIFVLASCQDNSHVTATHKRAPIYPDYADVTIPQNIAPLNFLLRTDADGVKVTARCGNETLETSGSGNKVCFDIDDWKDFMAKAAGKDVTVTVMAKTGGEWKQYKDFHWTVVKDKIDPYLTYRLIEPDYEVFSNLQIRERCIENFDERSLCTHGLVGNRCMNCHVVGNQNPALSMMYVRGEGGGAILNRNGTLRKLNIKTADMVSASVYAGFSRSGRYITFSTNIIIPAFHSRASKRLEVYDSKSDVYVADLDHNRIIRSPLLSDSTVFETFPTFSPDGRYIYYCTAPMVKLPEDIKDLKYSLCRIAFDEKTGRIGNKADTIYNARTMGKSVCHPRISPDGKYLLYTIADYGTFPIWHPETDLQMMDLQTGRTDRLAIVNSRKSDTYHSWSSNSRWFVFASKRDDGLYGKPYFCYIDRQGRAHKPFVLPQRDPSFYDLNLKSFNIPELSRGRMPFTARDVARELEDNAEDMK
jgi:hypothetical protein